MTDTPLRVALMRWAEGDLGAKAALGLLFDHGRMPERMDVAGFVQWSGDLAAPLFEKALADLDTEGPSAWYASGSERAILQLASSLAGKGEVNLWHALGKLDTRNSRLAARAVAEAAGVE